ncbi:class I SAM-dependent methyltransferase [Phenylobacterium deserti]|uniref:Methyltransferase n=1 Tax=Phenylobacterium deserti TaxID=1914756 RepID=A0A328AD29_9CAUL|nr:class I SAM-dependent methyltransferase [Phenylobacterium deserti]RAK52579.1 methyltransferase [Phenylobacterium deserti]
MRTVTTFTLAAALIATAAPVAMIGTPAAAQTPAARQSALKAAVAAPTRTPANTQRDRYRHPVETLDFFEVDPTDTVVEIWPGGGWYTEILAPYLANGGTYYAVAPERGQAGVRKMMEANPALYGKIKVGAFPAQGGPGVPDGTADVVVTFRNVHNMMMGDTPFADAAFRQMFAMLKPGGVLGVVDHRLPESADTAREKTSGYLKVSTVRRLAEAAGFQYVGASEVNANPKDTTDHPNGVWTLPPTYRAGDVDRAKYAAIGESDRMTLKFVKPR